MVVEVKNPANQNMHYGEINVGVLPVPDRIPQKALYSNSEANRLYNQLQFDIYQDQKKAKPPKKGEFPTVLKIFAGIIGLGAIIAFKKDIVSLFKKIKFPTRK